MPGKQGWGAILGCLVAAGGSACAQTAASIAAAPDTLRAVTAIAETSPDRGGQVMREIADPSTGDLWLLVRDVDRPAGPGRLVLAQQPTGTSGVHQTRGSSAAQPVPAKEHSVIHAGDGLMVEEHTAVADVRLEAVALEPAVKGACFKARLKLGGKVVRAMAVSPGHAVLAPDSEVAP